MTRPVKFRPGEAKKITSEQLVDAVLQNVALLRVPTESGNLNDAAIPHVPDKDTSDAQQNPPSEEALAKLDAVRACEKKLAEALVDLHKKQTAALETLRTQAATAQSQLADSYIAAGLASDGETAERYVKNFCIIANNVISSNELSRQL